ncbi:unnamed protein product, partial [Clonostachys chloroleuca]
LSYADPTRSVNGVSSFGVKTIYCPVAFFTKVSLLLLIARVFTVRRGISTPFTSLSAPYLSPISSSRHSGTGESMENALKLLFKKKIKIISIMGIGGIAVGITIWRVVLVVEYLHATDTTWWIAFLIFTAVMELTIGLICSCIPAINILIQERKYPRSRYSSDHSTHKHTINCKVEGTQIWHCERTASLTNETVETSELAFPKIDAQLAMLERLNPAVVRDGSLDERISAGQGDEKNLVQPIQLRNSVLTSIGRREGWLAEDKGEANEPSLRTADTSPEPAKITENWVWAGIWDGQNHTKGSVQGNELIT